MPDPLTIIRNRRAAIAKERQALDAEESDLEVTERTLMRLSAQHPGSVPAPAPVPATVALNGQELSGSIFDRLRARPTSQKGLIVATLKSADPAGFDTGEELRQTVKGIHGVDINKNSFQPYLSELKADGIIARDGQRVVLTAKGRAA